MPPVSRYHRQTLLPGIGEAGQERIGAAHAVIVGIGALGCASADLLARAGVGRITLIDRDVVELTNLQRQTLFTEADVGTPKAHAARERLAAVNSSIEIRAHAADFGPRNAAELLADSPTTLLLDGTDNYETRYLLNDLSVQRGVPYLYGGVIADRGMSAALVPGAGRPCLRCVFPEPPAPGSQPTCDTAGVLGSAVAMVAAAQAADALAILCGQNVTATLLEFSLWPDRRRRIELTHNAECACCVKRRFEFLDADRTDDTTSLCGANTVQVWPGGLAEQRPVDLVALAARLRPLADVTLTEYMLRASLREGTTPVDISVFPDGRALVRGTTSAATARTLYARYVGA